MGEFFNVETELGNLFLGCRGDTKALVVAVSNGPLTMRLTITTEQTLQLRDWLADQIGNRYAHHRVEKKKDSGVADELLALSRLWDPQWDLSKTTTSDSKIIQSCLFFVLKNDLKMNVNQMANTVGVVGPTINNALKRCELKGFWKQECVLHTESGPVQKTAREVMALLRLSLPAKK